MLWYANLFAVFTFWHPYLLPTFFKSITIPKIWHNLLYRDDLSGGVLICGLLYYKICSSGQHPVLFSRDINPEGSEYESNKGLESTVD